MYYRQIRIYAFCRQNKSLFRNIRREHGLNNFDSSLYLNPYYSGGKLSAFTNFGGKLSALSNFGGK